MHVHRDVRAVRSLHVASHACDRKQRTVDGARKQQPSRHRPAVWSHSRARSASNVQRVSALKLLVLLLLLVSVKLSVCWTRWLWQASRSAGILFLGGNLSLALQLAASWSTGQCSVVFSAICRWSVRSDSAGSRQLGSLGEREHGSSSAVRWLRGPEKCYLPELRRGPFLGWAGRSTRLSGLSPGDEGTSADRRVWTPLLSDVPRTATQIVRIHLVLACVGSNGQRRCSPLHCACSQIQALAVLNMRKKKFCSTLCDPWFVLKEDTVV